jgi:hypothetical protein
MNSYETPPVSVPGAPGPARLSRFALNLGVAAALLSGCSRSQSSIGLPGLVPQGRTHVTHPASGQSWMLPEAKARNLLYVSSPDANEVSVFTYPGGKPVGTLAGFDEPLGLCSDANGNVWVTNADINNGYGYLVEYAHGGTKPIAMLQDPNNAPQACSVDATTGNLAVANISVGTSQNIAIYSGAQGNPTFYSTVGFVQDPQTITYDGSGNLYFAAWRKNRAWLPKGGSSVERFSLNPLSDGWFAWDGKYLAVGEAIVTRYKLTGSKGTKDGPKVSLNDVQVRGQFWIHGSRIVIATQSQGNIYVYSYPRGGDPTNTISGLDDPYGVTVSVGPSR